MRNSTFAVAPEFDDDRLAGDGDPEAIVPEGRSGGKFGAAYGKEFDCNSRLGLHVPFFADQCDAVLVAEPAHEEAKSATDGRVGHHPACSADEAVAGFHPLDGP